MGLATSGLGTVSPKRASAWKLAQFVALVSGSAVGAVFVALLTGFVYVGATPADSDVEAVIVAFFALPVAAVAAVVGLAIAMGRLGIRPVTPILGATLLAFPVLAFTLGDVSEWLAVASLPVAAACAYALVHPPGRPLVGRSVVGGVISLALTQGTSFPRPVDAESLHELRERDYAELGFPLFTAPPPHGFLLDSIEVTDPDGFEGPATTLKISYRDSPVPGQTMSPRSQGTVLIDHNTRDRVIELTARRIDSELDPPAQCGFRVSVFGTVIVHSGAPCTEVGRHTSGGPIFTWSVHGERMTGTALSGVLVIGTGHARSATWPPMPPNQDEVPGDVVIGLLRSLQPTTPAELARSERDAVE